MNLDFLNLENVNILSKEEQKNVNGSMKFGWCDKLHSDKFEDRRAGGQPSAGATAFQNSNGCWIYPGMPWDAHPSRPPHNYHKYYPNLSPNYNTTWPY